MYTVMIVDDEDPVLESYSFMIEHDALDFSVSAALRSGFEALESAQKNRPDLVIMDISMPGMDGLQTIGELQKTFPDMVFILSTAYERFDLAQRAIPLGVFNYLVKPISRKTFLDTLEKIKIYLDERSLRSTDRLLTARLAAEALQVERNNFLSLLTWKSLGEKEWSQYRDLFCLTSDHGYIFLISVDAEEKEVERCYTEITERMLRKFQCIINEYRGLLMLFISDVAGAAYAEETLKCIVPGISGPESCWAVGSGSRRHYDELFRSFEEALALLPDIMEKREQASNAADHSFKEIRQAVSLVSALEELEPLFGSWLHALFDQEPYPVAAGRMIALFTLLMEDIRRETGKEMSRECYLDPVREIMNMDTPGDLEAWAYRTLPTIIKNNKRNVGMTYPAPLARAIDYLEYNYEKPLQLGTLADLCEISAGYLSRLFSEHLQTTFVDYLNAIRIKAAEKLLITQHLSVKETAYAVGYQDPNYFSRIFKKHKGVSPTSIFSRGTADAKR